MNTIKLNDKVTGYPEPISGTAEWFSCQEGTEQFCDIEDAEKIVLSGRTFSGMNCCLVHFPDGDVHMPFETKENVFIDQPVWDGRYFYFLEADFGSRYIRIYSYAPAEQKKKCLKELPLETVSDCYNLRLAVSPVTLYKGGQGNTGRVIWPEQQIFELGKTETFMFRDGSDFYFSEWTEDPVYHEYVVARNVETGEVKERYEGYLVQMADGIYWQIKHGESGEQ